HDGDRDLDSERERIPHAAFAGPAPAPLSARARETARFARAAPITWTTRRDRELGSADGKRPEIVRCQRGESPCRERAQRLARREAGLAGPEGVEEVVGLVDGDRPAFRAPFP